MAGFAASSKKGKNQGGRVILLVVMGKLPIGGVVWAGLEGAVVLGSRREELLTSGRVKAEELLTSESRGSLPPFGGGRNGRAFSAERTARTKARRLGDRSVFW